MYYAVVNILDYIELIGEESVVDVLSGFSCPKNKEIENFVRNNAVEFAKRKMSITYLLLDEYSRVLAIFAITHKAVQIWGKIFLLRCKKDTAVCTKNEKTDEYALSAFLIGQFGKNYQHKDAPVPDGGKMMEAVLTILKHVQREIGGGVVYLECEEKPELLNFYQNEKNRFRKFGERLSEKENVNYIQMLRIL